MLLVARERERGKHFEEDKEEWCSRVGTKGAGRWEVILVRSYSTGAV